MKIKRVRVGAFKRGGTPIIFFEKMVGLCRIIYHSTRNHKANNFVVTRNSWKCLWKKLQGSKYFWLDQSIML